MAAVIGFPRMRFVDPTGSATYYHHLGCGDIVSHDEEIPIPTLVCPLHGVGYILHTVPVIIDGTSVRDPD